MSVAVLYHNPRCSKSRAARKLLEERGADFSIVEYLREPLDRDELEGLGKRLGLPASEWIRSGEPEFSNAGLSADSSEDELLDAMAAHPILMERPIFERDGRAIIGRPPERVLEVL